MSRVLASFVDMPANETVHRPFTLPLIRPVTLGSGRGAVKYRTLDLRRPTPQEAKRVESCSPGVDAAINILALVAGVPQDVIERLAPRDFVAACNVMNQYIEGQNGEQV